MSRRILIDAVMKELEAGTPDDQLHDAVRKRLHLQLDDRTIDAVLGYLKDAKVLKEEKHGKRRKFKIRKELSDETP